MSTLAEFSHHDPPPRAVSSRAAAALLTIVLYALFVVLAWRAFLWAPARPAKPEIITTLLPDIRKPRPETPVPPVLAHMIRPHMESPAPPVITIAPPQTPAPLTALSATPSPLQGGGGGNGIAGQGGNGNGAGSAGCLDPVWMRAVTDRVRPAFYYPDAALASRITGVVTVHFAVRRDGKLDKLEIGKSSGDAGLDKAAIDIMQRAQPLPPIPERMHTDRVDGEIPINFGVRGFQASATAGHC